jgi:tetratricopeptide (TPR) repeat protein
MMKVLDKHSWQGAVLVILLVSFIGVAAQSQSSQDTAATIQVLQSQADTLMAVDQWEGAIPILHEALQLSRTIENQEEEARVLSLLGECYRQAQVLDRALTYYEQARAAYVALDMASSSEMAAVLFSLGETNASLGDLAEAFDVMYKAQQIFKDQPREEAQVVHEIGRVFVSLGRYEDALASYQQALGLYQVHGGPVDTIVIYQDMGRLLVQLGEYEEALNHFYKALSIAQEIAYTNAIAETYVEISGVYFALGSCEDALNALGQAEVLYKGIGSWLELANIQLQYGEVESVSGSYQQVMDHYRKAVEYLKMALSRLDGISPVEVMRYSRPVARLQILLRIGLCLETLEEWDDTVQIYQHAVEVIEAMPWLTSDEANGVYQRLISLLVRLGRGADALIYSERWRARVLRDLLHQDGLSLEQYAPGLMEPLSVERDIREACALLLPNEAVLEYMVTDTGVYLWVITKEGIGDPLLIPYPEEQLIEDMITLRQAIEDLHPDPIATISALASFYEQLVQPALVQLSDTVDTLILIPDGPLWYLPFAALIDQEEVLSWGLGTRYPYLVEQYTVAYLPSLASLPTLMAAGTDEEGSFVQFSKLPMRYPGLESSIAELAQCLTADEQHVSTYVGEDATESRLKAECSDARFLMLLCPVQTNIHIPLQSEILLAEDEENDGHLHAWEILGLDLAGTELVVLPVVETLLPYLQRLQDTMFNPEPWGELCYVGSPGNLGIQVASSQQVSGEVIRPEFLKKLVTGEDVTIWPLTFLSAGAKAVLQTLWLANPVALEKLLVAVGYYHEDGDTWAQSLRAAQLDLITDDVFKSSWLWAPYQLIGRWR